MKILVKEPTDEEYEKIHKQYSEVPVEKEAIEYSEEKMKEYHKGRTPSGKAISKTLQLDEDEENES